LQISVKTDVDKALKSMSRLHKKQMPCGPSSSKTYLIFSKTFIF